VALPGLDLRDGVTGLAVYAQRDLDALFRQTDEAQIRAALHDLLPALIEAYGAAAATLAANWYDEHRAQAEVAGSFTAAPADIPDSGAHALIGWASNTATDVGAFRTLIFGGSQRRITNYSRATVTGASVADPKATGWQRVGSGECGFCRMLIGRGAVYRQASADFASHDSCRCSAVPAWGGRPAPVRPYTPSERGVTDAERAAARQWVATNL
jgi:hypothetical protein